MKLSRIVLSFAFAFASVVSFSQVTPDMAVGITPYASYNVNDIDNVNPTNGNLFLKIPLLSYPQRGGKLRLNFFIYYNDKQWQAGLACQYNASSNSYNCDQVNGQWTPSGIERGMGFDSYAGPGVYVARDQFVGYITNYNALQTSTTEGTGSDSYTEQNQYITQYAITPDGGTHYIGDGVKETVTCGPLVPSNACPVPAQGTTSGFLLNNYPANDTSGFDQYGHDADGIIYGSYKGVNLGVYTNLAVTDANGNSITTGTSGWTDTYNRTIPGGSTGSGTIFFPNIPNGQPFVSSGMPDMVPGTAASSVPSECPSGTSAARVWAVPASESYDSSGTVTYYLCYTYYSYTTAFNLATVLPSSGVTYSVEEGLPGFFGPALMLTAIVLPDGSSYTFAYDQYLSLTQLGLPSGATVSYTWQNVVFDPYPTIGAASPIVTPISRALLTRTINPGDGQPAITKTYHWYITPSKDPTCGGTTACDVALSGDPTH
jgi:hypothetical protein